MFDDFATRTIDHLIGTDVILPTLPEGCFPSAILAGGAGLALFLYEAARTGRPELATYARRWIERSREAPPPSNLGFISGAVGIEAVAALGGVFDERADEIIGAARAIEAFASRPIPAELFEGAAGIAWSARRLLECIPAAHVEARAILDRVRAAMIARVLAAYTDPLAPSDHTPLGMAHGIAGELWTLVVMLGAKHPTVYARLEELAGLRMADPDNLVYWPPTLTTEPERANFGSFCNGMAGHTILWCEVAKQLRDEDTLALARECAETTAALDSSIGSLCCGLVGQSIALAKYAELSGDATFMQLSDDRLKLAVGEVEKDASRRLPLWWGATGLTLVAWNRSRVPCFES